MVSGSMKSIASSLLPQEEMLEVAKKKGKLLIGIPKEISFQENRVPLVPEAVALLTSNGHEIIVQREAGKAATSTYEEKDDNEDVTCDHASH